jgi:plastocyanin
MWALSGTVAKNTFVRQNCWEHGPCWRLILAYGVGMPHQQQNMKLNDLLSNCASWRFPALLTCALLASTLSVPAATTGVNVGNDFFSPATVQINAGDTVKWTWIGSISHSSTSTSAPVLWDSGIQGNGFTFSHTFPSAGSFPYECVIHVSLGQVGTVNVQAPVNVPPTVALTSPTNGATFAAPWAGTIRATASDTDDTVSTVAFFAGSTLLGTVTNPPASVSFPVPNLAAGSYVLKAVATDSRGATNTSAAVTVNVIAVAPIELTSPKLLSATSFQFTYSASPGLSYIIRRAAGLPNWVNLATNTASTSSVTFVDSNAKNPINFYSIQLMPNP